MKSMPEDSFSSNNNFKFLSDLVASDSDLDIRSYTLKIKG